MTSNRRFAGATMLRCLQLAAVSFLATIATANSAQAVTDICLEDRFGGAANCTANDFSVTRMEVDTGTSADIVCTSQFDTVTLDGYLVAQSNAPDRYDIGIYLDLDGTDARTGLCNVTLLDDTDPPGGGTPDLDGDGCPDGASSGTYRSYFTNLTLSCTDFLDNATLPIADTTVGSPDGFLDLALCTSWDINTMRVPCPRLSS